VVAAVGMEFGLLGPLVVRCDGLSRPIARGKQRVLLAALLLHANQVVPADDLVDVLWPVRPPPSARQSLQNYVKRLRSALGDGGRDRIVTHPGGYRIRVEAGELDVTRFEALVAAARADIRAGAWERGSAGMAGALSLWRGKPLADVESEALAAHAAPRLAEMRLQAAEARLDADLHLGGHQDVLPGLRELAAAHPLREQARALLMLALYRSGRQAEALAVYQDIRAVLVREIGAEPGMALRDLHQRMLAADPALDLTGTLEPTGTKAPAGPGPAGPGASTASGPRQLPASAAHFVGRAPELAALTALLQRTAGPGPGRGNVTAAVSTIGGMAGIGKTALALHWAHQVADRFPDGQLYVNLRGFGPAAPMAPADALRGFLDALRDPGKPVPADADAQEAMYRSLTADRRILIVLDNARDEEQVRPLLPGSASCLTLITSRSQLAGLITTNSAIPLRLALLTGTEARELLSHRLGQERLAAEPAATDQFVATCTGLPLALCIAAARAALAPGFPLAALAEQISWPGLDALSGGDPYADLRNVFSWSYQRLRPDTARLFRCLSLFPGPDVSATAAAAITPPGRAGALLAELTSAHLLDEYVLGRFRLHDLLARYADECSRQEDTDAARREVTERVLTWYTAAAIAATRVVAPGRPTIPEADQPDPVPAGLATRAGALRWLESERRNLVAAVEVAARSGFDRAAVTLTLTLLTLFTLRTHFHDRLTTHLSGIEAARRMGDRDAEANLCTSISVAYVGLGRPAEGIDGLHRALAIWQSQGDLTRQAAVRIYLGTAYSALGRTADALSECEKAAALIPERGNGRVECVVLSNLGWFYQELARPEDALSCYLRAYPLVETMSDGPLAGTIRANLASVYLQLGRTDDAIEAAAAAIDAAKRWGPLVELANAHRVRGDALNRTSNHTDARSHWRSALAIYQELGDPRAEDMATRFT
jgi:DNA-binding SARP family transcriptional activator/tetratricopeptide (TPR) repeat protein